MNLLKVPKGILANFNVKNLCHFSQKTFVSEYYIECIPKLLLHSFDKLKKHQALCLLR